MILELRGGRTVELRSSALWGSEHLIPIPGADGYSEAGVQVDDETVAGLPTVASAVRIPAEIIAGLPLDVYDSRPGARWTWTLSKGRWQNALLDQPDLNISGFDFWSDVSSHIDGFGNAYAYKVRDRGRVSELFLLHPERVCVELDERRRKVFKVHAPDNSSTLRMGTGDVVHFRGWDPCGAPAARSPIERHAEALGVMIARDRFAARWLANDARPSLVVTMPGNINRDQAADFLEQWDARHKGPSRTNRPALLGGGMQAQVLPVSLRDAQFVEAETFSVSHIARIFSVPRSLLEADTANPMSVEQELARFVRLHLVARLARIERALAADPDLFGTTSAFRPRFDVSELMRGDLATTAQVIHQLRQVGMMTANEGRSQVGLPPIDGGDELQATPVGGAPNAADTESETTPVPPPADTTAAD